jgi:peptidyl-prolyl cis-trans isomerase SurA
MHVKLFCLIICAAAALVAGCSPKQHDIIVAKLGDSTITLADYENLYVKSNGSREMGAKATLDEREKFLDLMTKFRLKLADAYRRGLDKSPDVLNEIDQYKGSLAASYLTDREITQPGVRKLYDRRSEEFRASHILLTLTNDASAEDSAAAYTKAYEIINKLKGGANFGDLAVEYSQDPTAKQNKGDLYYFMAGQMVPSFEDAVFKMKPGEFTTTPVRTQYGLHIIKLLNRKPAVGEIQCSHIMTRFPVQDPSPADTLEAYTKIQAIRDSLTRAIDFAELAKRNSADPGSAPKGGDLGWFSRRRWIQSFDEVAFTLKPGQVSGVVRTIYGYHLIKCFDAHPPKNFDDAKKDVQQLYQQSRFSDDYQRYFSRLQQETKFKLHQDVLSTFIASLDSNKTGRDSAWTSTIPDTIHSASLVTFGTRAVTVDSMIALLKTKPDFVNTPLRASPIRSAVDKAAEQLVFTVKAETIEGDYPEFASIMREYREGILLYQIEQDQVWNRIAVNDSSLHRYFEGHRDKFTWPDRVEFTEIKAVNDSLANLVYDQSVGGKSFAEIAAEDSLRMNQPHNYQLVFGTGAAQLTAQTKRVLDAIVGELSRDGELKTQFTAHPDTASKKSQNVKLAAKRFNAVKAYLKKKMGIADDRIVTLSLPLAKDTSAASRKEARALNVRLDVDLVGRKAMIVGKVETGLLPVSTDERTKLADSLAVGAISRPFKFKFSYSVIRVDKKDPARQKTFEEAGTEISGGFQEYESKRLESEWIDGLRKMYPVTEYKEALKNAFAPTP